MPVFVWVTFILSAEPRMKIPLAHIIRWLSNDKTSTVQGFNSVARPSNPQPGSSLQWAARGEPWQRIQGLAVVLPPPTVVFEESFLLVCLPSLNHSFSSSLCGPSMNRDLRRAPAIVAFVGLA